MNFLCRALIGNTIDNLILTSAINASVRVGTMDYQKKKVFETNL